VYIADTDNHRIRKVTVVIEPVGTSTTEANTPISPAPSVTVTIAIILGVVGGIVFVIVIVVIIVVVKYWRKPKLAPGKL
jgi:hypothetical protein